MRSLKRLSAIIAYFLMLLLVSLYSYWVVVGMGYLLLGLIIWPIFVGGTIVVISLIVINKERTKDSIESERFH